MRWLFSSTSPLLHLHIVSTPSPYKSHSSVPSTLHGSVSVIDHGVAILWESHWQGESGARKVVVVGNGLGAKPHCVCLSVVYHQRGTYAIGNVNWPGVGVGEEVSIVKRGVVEGLE